jgi:hypothetical protein
MMWAFGHDIGRAWIAARLCGRVPTRLIAWALRLWKKRDRKKGVQYRAARRVTIHVLHPGVLASMDALQLGRFERARVMGEHVIDVVSLATRGAAVTGRLNGALVVDLLEAIRRAHGEVPFLVLAMDGGSENVNGQVMSWCAKHHVIVLQSVPHTPQHNPWSERENRELRAISGLLSSSVLASIEEAGRCFESALRVRHHARRRRTLGDKTPAVRDLDGRVRYTPEQRERVWRAVCAAQQAARTRHADRRERAWAVREVTLCVLEQFGLLYRTRGGVRIQRVIPEIVS